jgi:hypothetical protein
MCSDIKKKTDCSPELGSTRPRVESARLPEVSASFPFRISKKDMLRQESSAWTSACFQRRCGASLRSWDGQAWSLRFGALFLCAQNDSAAPFLDVVARALKNNLTGLVVVGWFLGGQKSTRVGQIFL